MVYWYKANEYSKINTILIKEEKMSMIDKDGMINNNKVILKRFPHIEHGNLPAVKAIVVHQTDAPTAKHTFNAYNSGGNGTHFLIAKDGLIFQTASLKKRCYHVGVESNLNV
jgi:N-acetyl-anhydromuramyl-L-alanine amidase AmpD